MSTRLLTILFFLILATQTVSAQLCQGSLGDPIVNISFGAGPDPGPALSAAATGYQYVTNDCPNDGFYTLRGRSTNCFGGSWHNLNNDHTGNANGYFMLVNASIQPSAFYLDTVRGLCGNTTYEFAAWVVNMIKPESCQGTSNQPNLTFRIEKTDGSLLQTYNSNNIPPLASPLWKQYGFFFTTPISVSDVVLRIINNAPGGCGNDLGLDDITFRPCGPLLTSSITGSTTTTEDICVGTARNFSFACTVSGGFYSPTYQWQTSANGGAWTDISGANNVNLNYPFSAAVPAGTYAFRLAVAEAGNLGSPQCRIASKPVTVRVNTNPVTTTANNGPVCEGSQLQLDATGGSQYQWSGPNAYSGTGATQLIRNIQLNQAGKYYVLVNNDAGCTHLDSSLVNVIPGPTASVSFTRDVICSGDSIQLEGSGGGAYEWNPPTGLSATAIPDPKASPADSTRYRLVVTDANTCTDTAYTDIIVLTQPIADAGPDRAMLENDPITLSAQAIGNSISFSWVPSPNISNINSLNPQVNPPMDEWFILNVSSPAGCGTDRDSMLVKVYSQVFVPNTFTPNDDRINDNWNIPALSALKNFELIVFNRFGQKVFYLKNENRPWDGTFKGKEQPSGVYTFVIYSSRFINPMKGTVMIIR